MLISNTILLHDVYSKSILCLINAWLKEITSWSHRYIRIIILIEFTSFKSGQLDVHVKRTEYLLTRIEELANYSRLVLIVVRGASSLRMRMYIIMVHCLYGHHNTRIIVDGLFVDGIFGRKFIHTLNLTCRSESNAVVMQL